MSYSITLPGGVPDGSVVKNLQADARDAGLIPGWEDPLEKEIATYSSILAWTIPYTYRGAWWATVHAIGRSNMT